MSDQDYSRRSLVTGGAGFVGAHLISELVRRGVYVVVADFQSSVDVSPLGALGAASSVDYRRVDLCDRAAVEAMLSGEFHTIFHLAAQPIAVTSSKCPHRTFSSNVETTKVMLDLVHRRRARQLILASSACVFGVPDAEDCPLRESSRMSLGMYPYTESKQQAEALVRDSGVRASVARFVNLFGEADWHSSRLVPRVIRQLLLGKPLNLSRSTGQSVLDFLHVSDAVSALLQVEAYLDDVSMPLKSESIFNFGSGNPISVLRMIENVSLAFDGRKRSVFVPREGLEPTIHKYMSSAHARQVLGWIPQNKRMEALTSTISWYARYSSKLKDVDTELSNIGKTRGENAGDSAQAMQAVA